MQGWVARLRVSATGQPVKRGEVLFTLYSPELFAAQEEYILALASQKAASAGGRSDYLVKAAEKKLHLSNVTPSRLAAIAKRGEPIEELPILAPASGYIIEKDVVEGAARRDLLETVTHGPRGDIMSVYTSFPWPAVCGEVAKLRVRLRGGDLLSLPRAAAVAAGDLNGLEEPALESTSPSSHSPKRASNSAMNSRPLKRPQRDLNPCRRRERPVS